MAASVDYRQEEMSSGVTKEKGNGNELNLELLQKSNQFLEALDSESENPLIPETKSMVNSQDPGADALLNSENNTTDYDWLLSPPRYPIPSQEMEEQNTLASHNLVSNGQSTSPEARVENPLAYSNSTTNVAPKLPASSNGVKPSIRQPSPSRKATPTTQATITSSTKPSRSSTPTSRATVATTKPVAPSKRSTTPTPRPSLLPVASKSKSKSKSMSRSSTPTPQPSIIAASKSTSRSSTPTPRPSVIASSKSTSRSSTPTQRPSNPSVNRSRSSSAIKAHGSSASVKSRPLKNAPEMSGSADEAPQNIKKSLPEKPNLSTVKILKRTSCSPSIGQVSNGGGNNSVKSGPMRGRGYSSGNDDVNPVLMGTKMVERVVNMRKLAPPKQDHISNQNDISGKLSVSQDNSGFGRTLSKKSFDMALRHLDIRRSMPGNMRAMITKVPASSVYSVRSESTKTQTINASSDSLLATSSSASSDHSLSSENGHFYPQ